MERTESGPAGWARSMRLRIVLLVAVLLLVSSLGSLLILRAALLGSLDREVEESLVREAQEFTRLTNGIDPRTGEPFDGDLPAIFDVYFSREVPDQGETLMAFVNGELYDSDRVRDAAQPDEISDAIRYWTSLDKREQGTLDTAAGTTRYVAIPLQGADGADGLFVVANFPESERTELDDAVRTQSVIQVGVFLVASMLALVLAGRVLRPLRQLAATARETSESDLDNRIPVRGHDEASQIAATFNDMMARLQRSFTSQRQFLDDTGHELRVPLTIIRGHLELLGLDEDPQTRQATVSLVLDELDRASRLIDNLLVLAKSERPDFIHREATDLGDLIQGCQAKARMLADRNWVTPLPDPAVVEVDRNRLTQALLQLADNATKHTQPGDRIEIGARVSNEWLHLWVDDTGTGVDPSDAQVIFERFRRGRHDGPPGPSGQAEPPAGSGLGLAIVAAIASNHGGDATLVDRPGPGARFEIRVPVRP